MDQEVNAAESQRTLLQNCTMEEGGVTVSQSLERNSWPDTGRLMKVFKNFLPSFSFLKIQFTIGLLFTPFQLPKLKLIFNAVRKITFMFKILFNHILGSVFKNGACMPADTMPQRQLFGKRKFNYWDLKMLKLHTKKAILGDGKARRDLEQNKTKIRQRMTSYTSNHISGRRRRRRQAPRI